MNDTRKHYVYALIDPRTNKPFYIGKGSGIRMRMHVGRSKVTHSEAQFKSARVREIQALGLTVITEKLAEFDTAEEAFAIEAKLILEDDQLTNVFSGGPITGRTWSTAELKRQAEGRPRTFIKRPMLTFEEIQDMLERARLRKPDKRMTRFRQTAL